MFTQEYLHIFFQNKIAITFETWMKTILEEFDLFEIIRGRYQKLKYHVVGGFTNKIRSYGPFCLLNKQELNRDSRMWTEVRC